MKNISTKITHYEGLGILLSSTYLAYSYFGHPLHPSTFSFLPLHYRNFRSEGVK